MAEKAVDALKNYIVDVSQADWEKQMVYDKWFKLMEKCIVHKGKYFFKHKSDFHKIITVF